MLEIDRDCDALPIRGLDRGVTNQLHAYTLNNNKQKFIKIYNPGYYPGPLTGNGMKQAPHLHTLIYIITQSYYNISEIS